MASHDVFRSSPMQGSRREHLEIRSSSPDLPPLQDILSQGVSRPPMQSGSKAMPIPVDPPAAFISTRNLLQTIETVPERHPVSNPDRSVPEPPCEPDHEESVVEILPENPTGKRKSQARKGKEKESSGVKKTKSKPRSSEAEKVRKQPRARAKKGKNGDAQESVKSKSKAAEPTIRETTNSVDNVSDGAHIDQIPKLKAPATEEEGLNLEPAIARKVDWTPPPQKTIISVDTNTSAFKQLTSPESAQQTTVFRDLVQGYSCADETLESIPAPSDEDSSFLKKRKRIDLVAINDVSVPEPEVSDKSPAKKKAPKKKARTITELATATYRKTTQPESAPSASLRDHFPVKDTGSVADPAEPSKIGKGKGKASSRKKPSKTSKKKAPPKPILLSPGAALDQVARQDFVFGTSSQLAREPSPTVTRDIQAALRLSTRLDSDDFAVPINSDDFEPSKQRPRLWDAAARDADGDLFDVEVVDLAGKSPQILAANNALDPFGYVRGGDQDEVLAISADAVASEDADSFINLSDILPSPSSKPVPIDDTPYFSESGLSASTNIPDQSTLPAGQLSHQIGTVSTQQNDLQPETDSADMPTRPNYDIFTDAQLAKEIKTYGFKPIKRRNAMIALLDQCWQSKARLGHGRIHTKTSRAASSSTSEQSGGPTLAAKLKIGSSSRSKQGLAATEPQDPPSPAVPTKTPRGRPRKNSISAVEPQEPPPSAQPPETPKRPRGRPRRDSLSSSPVTSSRSRTRSISPKKDATTHGAARRKAASKPPIIEIPDSASDGDDFASSPDSTVEQMFSSPPPLNMSLTATDETELSLAVSPDDQQTTLFGYVTEAIKSAPRTTDPENPSWHEKILLYDPIILEDLAAWLNSGQLSRVGFDAEISPGEVKKWCESKSVCSVWRVNLRGKERKRF